MGGLAWAGLGAGLLALYLLSKKSTVKVKETLSNPPPYKVSGKYLVSVIIPTLEEENYLPSLLRSINQQTYQNVEVIVVDSSPSPSREKTKHIAEEFKAKYIYEPVLNVSRARNRGAREAKGEIFLFCDADCIILNDYIERLVDELEKGAILVHGADPLYEDGIWQLGSVLFRGFFKPRVWTSGRGIAIWRDAFFKIGGYNESIDPTKGGREDLQLGFDVEDHFPGGVVLLPTSYFGVFEHPRRVKKWEEGGWEKTRGVRNHLIEY